jgi:hypothetical protein
MGPTLDNFFYELHEIMQFDPLPNLNEILFKVRDHAEGYFWNGKVTQTGMLDWIYVNAASDFVIFLFAIVGSLILGFRIWQLKTKASWNKVNPENFNSRKTLFPAKVGISSARMVNSH